MVNLIYTIYILFKKKYKKEAIVPAKKHMSHDFKMSDVRLQVSFVWVVFFANVCYVAAKTNFIILLMDDVSMKTIYFCIEKLKLLSMSREIRSLK